MRLSLSNVLIIIAVLAFGGFGVYLFLNQKTKIAERYLPHFGPFEVDSISNPGSYDTTFHALQNFHLINQDSVAIQLSDFNNKIIVADFFFTNCESICPVMSTQLKRLFKRYENNKSLAFISHTVDPERDSIQQLREYASLYGAKTPLWHLVTGEKKHLYELARYSYFVVNTKGDGGPEDFIHTQNFALIDRHHNIRGYYDGTDSLQVDQLANDIDLLIQNGQ